MIEELSLENFRVFRNKTTFKFKPITILTGPNNSGKSSVNKALFLLQKTYMNNHSSEKENYFPKKLNFSGLDIDMANLAQIISYDSNNKTINFKFKIYNENLKESITISSSYSVIGKNSSKTDNPFENSFLFFGDLLNKASENNKTNNSILSSFSVEYKNKTIIDIKSNANNPIFFEEALEVNYDFSTLYKVFKEVLEAHYSPIPEKRRKITLDNEIRNFLRYLADTKHSFKNNKEYEFRSGIDGINLLVIDSLNDYIRSFMDKGLDETQISKKFFDAKVKDVLEIMGFIKNNYNQIHEDDILRLMTLQKYNSLYLGEKSSFIAKISSVILNDPDIPNSGQLMSFFDFLNSADNIYNLNDIPPGRMNGISVFISFVNKLLNDILYESQKAFSQFIKIPVVKLLNDTILKDSFTESLLKDIFENQDFFKSFETIDSKKEKSVFEQTSKTFSPHLKQFKFFKKWISKLSIADSIEVSVDEYNRTYKIWLIKSGKKIKINEVGLGVSQLTFLLSTISYLNVYVEKSFFLIEEPEANLHPKLQSMLADLFLDAHLYLNKKFIIETHSEYLIRKLQFLIAKGECKPEDVIIYYIDDPDPSKREEGAPQVREITIDKFGRMSQDFGKGFFDEADNLAIQLFQLNQQNFN